jgi:hypothetical protein
VIDVSEHEERFWELAELFLVQPAVTRSTMMGLPCLRTSGQFVASFDRRTGDLLVKLPEARVDELVGAGKAHSFTPAGRRFRRWAVIPPTQRRAWSALLTEAVAFVANEPPSTRRRRR